MLRILLLPLDRLRSIKLKLGLVIVGSVLASVAAVIYGWTTGIRPRWLVMTSGLVALATIQYLAHGMTKPLREMAAASRAMAEGDYSQRIVTSSVDEVGELAQAFNVMSARLQEVDSERRSLIANVSHELRTPLAGARARLENMVDGVEPADPAQIGGVLRSVERMSRLVDQLLDLSRLEAGVAPMRREFVSLADVVDAVIEEAELASPTVQLSADVRGVPDAFVDPERIHQVLTNLVANAIRHSPAGSPVVIEAWVDAGTATLAVSDEGPGIPADLVPRVFERYASGGGAREASGGSGLGLAITRWIVQLHGGSIDIGPNTPHGCRVVVRLPTPGSTGPASSV